VAVLDSAVGGDGGALDGRGGGRAVQGRLREAFGHPGRGDARRPGGLADEDALLACEPPGLRLGVLDGDGLDLVEQLAVQQVADEPRPHPLVVVGTGLRPVARGTRFLVVAGLARREDRVALGLDGHDGHVGERLQQAGRRPGDRAAGSDPGDEGVDLAVADGVDDLLGGRPVVGFGVGLVLELPEPDRPVGGQFVGPLAGGRHVPGHEVDLGAVRPQQPSALLGHPLGHHQREVVPPGGADHGQPDPGVAAGRFHDPVARFECARPLGGLDHRERRPVLRGPPRIEPLQLRRHRRPLRRTNPHERRADGVQYGGFHRSTFVPPT